MANFNGLILTQAGANLQDKIATSGATLQFTRAAIGDGLWPAGLDPTSLTGLVSEKKSLAIQGLTDEGTGQHKISVLVDNTGLAVGFMTREIGVFADDPDLGEVLYQVTSADSPDYLPPDGGATHIEMALDLIVVTSSASSVTAVINEGLVYARKEDVSAVMAALTAHKVDTDNPHGVTREQLGAASAVDLEALASLVAAIGAPIGTLFHNVIPGYEPPLCFATSGQLLLREDYPEIWALAEPGAVSEAEWSSSDWGCFSVGDGATTFRAPLIDGEFVRALDRGRGVDAGRVIGSFQADEFKNHTHTVPSVAQFHVGGDNRGDARTADNVTKTTSAVGGSETRPRNIAYPAWIKYA